jgi:hypothetical protein
VLQVVRREGRAGARRFSSDAAAGEVDMAVMASAPL